MLIAALANPVQPQEIRDIKKFLEFARRPDAKGEQQQRWRQTMQTYALSLYRTDA